MAKRYRTPTAKPNEILVKFGKAGGDIGVQYCWPDNSCGMRSDARIVAEAFEGNKIFNENNLIQELDSRGYDITTLKFSVKKKE